MTNRKPLFLLPLLCLGAGPAVAHLPPETHGSFLAGASHPLFGLDHILAMVAVGLWALQLGGRTAARALWAVPGAFVGAMALGYILANFGLPLPAVEPMILASTIVISALVMLAAKPGLGASLGLVALFGLFHGHAHGGELGSAGALQFGIGFVAVTATLHGLGVLGGSVIARAHAQAPRALGALGLAGGLALAFG